MRAVLAEISSNESAVDAVDVQRIKNEDGLLLRPILAFMDENASLDINNNSNDDGCISKITSNIMNTLKWRKEYQLNKMTADDFPSAFFKHNYFMVAAEEPYESTVILMKDETKHEKVSSHWNKLVERFMVYFTEHVTSKYFDDGYDVIYLMDFTQFGYKHIDSSLCMTFYDIIGKHYPRITIQNNAIDLPWYAKPVMKLVMKILPPSVSQEFKTMTRSELMDKLGQKFVPVSLGGQNALRPAISPPPKFTSVREVGQKNAIAQGEIEKMINILGQE